MAARIPAVFNLILLTTATFVSLPFDTSSSEFGERAVPGCCPSAVHFTLLQLGQTLITVAHAYYVTLFTGERLMDELQSTPLAIRALMVLLNEVAIILFWFRGAPYNLAKMPIVVATSTGLLHRSGRQMAWALTQLGFI
ncbi:unnamed protein product [Cercospora beticola]|nr:unnamed protein product [Cercospora beticola]